MFIEAGVVSHCMLLALVKMVKGKRTFVRGGLGDT